jgi:tRNA A37 threonylcarbamoyladenosine biosynthesis protein TsaE
VTEADRTTLFLKYSKARINHSFVFEAKICKEKSLSFNAVKEHQEIALFRVKHGYFNYKIPDAGFDQKPFDGFQMVMQPAYVVIFWWQHRGDKRITIIDIDVWLEEKKNSERKSITYERAKEIASIVEEL